MDKINLTFFKILIILSFLNISFSKQSYSQQTTNSIDNEKFRMFSSPTSQSLGTYGKTPVNLFSGLHQLSIPIVELKDGDISVPISIAYSSGGNIVNSNPGWVGMSWNLNAGGVITRQRNGEADESTGGDFSWPTDNGGITVEDHSYLAYGGRVTNDWPNIPHDYFFAPIDRNPDEFFFNFNGISGSFFIDEQGHWNVKSKQNLTLTIKEDIGKLGVFYSVFKAFTLTDGKGVEYFFGGDESNVEVSVGTSQLNNWMIQNGWFNHSEGSTVPSNAWGYTSFPNAWYLKEIRFPNGKNVNFSYQKAGEALNRFNIEVSGWPYYIPPEESSTGSTLETTFLRTIETDNIKAVFNISKSNALYHFGVIKHNPSTSIIKNDYYKLDEIIVSTKNDNNSIIKKINFSYVEQPDTRLKLKKLWFENVGSTLNAYEFSYNPLPLPDLLAKTDHWGYHNGNQSSQEANGDYCEAEMLTSVKYPTGGHTDFFYEPNEYSKVAKQYPFELEQKAGIGGGVRIRKITDYPLSGQNYTREYFYVNDGFTNSGTSSGVLSGTPRYHYSQKILTGSTTIFNISQNFIVNTPSRTFGKDITYSRVIEKDDRGFKVYHYSNLDNGFMDVAALAIENPSVGPRGEILPPDPNNMLYLYSSRELSRGNLLKEEYFTGDGTQQIVYAKEYVYNEDLNQYVKAQGKGPNGGLVKGKSFPSSFVYYVYTPYLKRSTENTYLNGSHVVKIDDFIYDSHNQLKEVITKMSNDKTSTTQYKYSYDFISGVYPEMVSKNIIGPVIETTKILNDKQIYLNKTNYDKFNNLLLPKSIEEQNDLDPIETKQVFNKYDLKGNLLEVKQAKGINTSYLWSYNNQYPIAEIKNSNYDTIKDILEGAISVSDLSSASPTDAQVKGWVAILRNSGLLKNAQITSYTYKPLIGMTSQTDPKGMTIYYEYDEFQRLKNVKDQNGNILKNNTYHYKN